MSAREFRIKGRHVLWGLIAFFGVIFAVNGAFIYYALATHPGDDVKDAYVAGIEFNREIAEKREQQKLGWQANLTIRSDGRGGQFMELAFVDKQGKPVRGLKIKAKLRHPELAKLDRPIKFALIKPGVFRADVDEPPAAQWYLEAEVRNDIGEVFRLRHRL